MASPGHSHRPSSCSLFARAVAPVVFLESKQLAWSNVVLSDVKLAPSLGARLMSVQAVRAAPCPPHPPGPRCQGQRCSRVRGPKCPPELTTADEFGCDEIRALSFFEVVVFFCKVLARASTHAHTCLGSFGGCVQFLPKQGSSCAIDLGVPAWWPRTYFALEGQRANGRFWLREVWGFC